ncbi:MAG TPA: carboxypeptidase regulatory-like domain-containing protein [Pyrinomonadaceae bacterium]|nr:carboxypeptidase regulatory-like domain-containing protein [Pyrinomonadaceae bacterium]
MTSKKTWTSIMIALAISLCLSGLAIGQEVTGSIVGTVKDSSGAVVPGATVTITDPSRGNQVVRTTTTNDNGEFSAPNLTTSVFDVTVEAANFKKAVSTGIKVDVGQRRAVDIELTAGNISESVTVEADRVSVELSTPTAGTTINGDQVREIPINNRNFVQLVALAPGVSNDLSDQVYVGTTNPEGQANTINISVNGARSSQNTFTVDGADVTDRGSNITIQAYPSVDSIGEFKILRSMYPAESGRSGGGQVNIVTRSGTSKFHGSAFEFVRNEVFNANNFLSNAVTTAPFGRESNGKAKRAPFHYNNFGWTLGGPIYFLKFGERDPDDSYFGRWSRTFFFFSEEFRRDSRFTAPITTTVPTQALRNGVFPMDVCINLPGQPCTGANVLTAGTPLPNPRYSPAARAYLNQVYNLLPLPNAVTATAPFNLVAQLRNVSNFQQEIIKVDHSFSDNLSMYYRYERDEIPTIDGNALFSSGGGLPDVSTTSTNSPGRTHTLQVTYSPTSNFIIEGRYNYSYGAILSKNIGLLALTNSQVPITLPFANERDRIPSITGNGFTGLTSFGPYDNFSDKHNFSGTATWLLGSHSVKFGGVYSMYRKNENALAGNNEGLFSAFSNALAPGVGNGAGQTLPAGYTLAQTQSMQQWAQFLVGNVSTFTQASFDYTADLRQKAIEGFVQDEWRIRPNLTLYAGVRYSFFGSPWDRNGRLTNFVPELFDPAAAPRVTGAGNRIIGAGITGNWCNGIIANSQNFITGPASFNCTPTVSDSGKFVVDSPKTDFAPRVGFAWDPFGKGETSVRAGYGIYHEQILNGVFLQHIGTNVPYQQTASLSNVLLDNPAGGASISAAVQNLRAVQKDWKTPYMQHWSLDMQHQLTKNTVFTIGYYGSKGTNLIGISEINEVPPGVALASTCAAGNTYVGGPTPTLVPCQPAGYAFRNATTPINNPNIVGTTRFSDLLILDQLRPYRGYRSIAMIQPKFGSNYHSMQAFVQHRLSGSSQLNFAYTWSKNLTDAQTDRNSAPQNSYNARAEWARATLDRRHVMNFNYVYELPWFDKQQGFVGKLLGGIQFAGIATYQTGLPFTAVTSNLDYAGLGLINANPTARPNQICNPNANAPQTQQQWFDTSCIPANPAIVTSGTAAALQNTVGTAGRGTIEGPSTKRVDFTTTKNIRFGENIRIQLRWEIFNIFNWTNFRTIVVNNTAANFGAVTAVRDPRTMQFGAKFSF